MTHYGHAVTASDKEVLNDDAMDLLIQQFLDMWTHQVLKSPLSKKWHKYEVQLSALEVMVMNGVNYTPEELETVAHYEEHMLIMDLVSRCGDDVRNRFEQIIGHLKNLTIEATSIRQGVEKGEEDQVAAVIEAKGDSILGQQVMKNTVVCASKELADLQRCEKSWKKSMEARLHRLTRSQELAEHAQQQLLAVEAQLEAVGGDSNQKSKKVLQGLAAGQSKALMHTVFSAWNGEVLGNMQDKAIRAKYEAILAEAEKKLMHFKENKIKNIKSVLGRASRGKEENLEIEVFRNWRQQTVENRFDADSQAKMKVLNEKLAKQKQDQMENTKKVMARMSNDKDETLVVSAWGAMKAFCESYSKNKEFEDAVKKSEQNMKDHLAKKKDDAKKVLDSMNNATSTGLMSHCFLAWRGDVDESLRRKKLEEQMYDTDCRLKSFLDKQAGNAMGVQTRTIDQMNENLTLKFWGAWLIETKSNKLETHYSKKMDGKRDQLNKVHKLFKKFAQELEEGLGNIEGDSSRNATGRRSKQGMTKGDGSVSLPDIRGGSGRRPA
jgi:hypothetical protein